MTHRGYRLTDEICAVGGVLFASASRHSIPAGCLVAQLGTAAATEGVELGPESRKAPDESLG